MLYAQNKIKFSLYYNMLLKTAFFVICSIFFTTGNANLLDTDDQTNKSKNDNSYFLDIDNLQPSCNSSDGLLVYTEKENPAAEWIFLPIKSSMTDYYKSTANVVAAEFHKRIDEHSLVPPTKFLIGKDMNNNGGYQLLGSAYKKLSFTAPILEIRKKRRFDDHTNNIIYGDYKVERIVSMWRYLGLPVAPDSAALEVSEDNRLIRYDYYNAFQYNNPEIHKKCFCISYFPISDYDCNLEYIKTFKQELRVNHKETLEKVLLEIKIDSEKYLEGRDLQEVSQALNIISSKF